MSTKSPSPDADAFFDDLESVVYGCHSKARDLVKRIFEEAENLTFSFAEYFLDEPVTTETATEDLLKGRKLYFPFLPWAASTHLFQIETLDPAPPGDHISTKFLAKTGRWKRALRKSCRAGTALAVWEPQRRRIVRYFNQGENRWEDADQFETITNATQITSSRTQAKALGNPNGGPNEALVSYEIQLHLWSKSDVSDLKPLIVIRVPIGSGHCYYGHLLVAYQEQEPGEPGKHSKLSKRLQSLLTRLAAEHYAPTLTLLHMSKWERVLKASLEGDGTTVPSLDTPDSAPASPLVLKWDRSPDPIQRAFGQLWAYRRVELTTAVDRKAAKKRIEDTIILHKYHIASPTMIKQVREVVRGASAMKARGDERDSLPSALVFGEAGSGKDKLARLIPTLTKDFWAGEVSTHNMAAVKPSILAMPLMFGVRLDSSSVGVSGLFHPKWEDRANDKLPKAQVLILDELNSLDYDMQGSLLRLLENNEVSPLFGNAKPEPINALVVGIVNEDPERVTREQELDLLDSAKEFLGQAETARLYESLHNARRLRPDLIYRLKRGVYVRMPPLRERREDIPFLFSYPCKKAIKDLLQANPVDGVETLAIQIDLEAYDELMRPEIRWPGNIRQLQAAAMKVGNQAWRRWNRTRRPNGTNSELSVGREDVRGVLKECFPEAYPSGLEDDLLKDDL